MWLISAPFDSEEGIEKTRVLLSGTTTSVGRRDCTHNIPSKKVSHKVCDLLVDEFTIESVGDPSSKPSLRVVNRKTGKTLKVTRQTGGSVSIDTNSEFALQDGDKIHVASDSYMTINWKLICCYSPREKPATLKQLASIGVHLTVLPNPAVTHHITSTYNASPQIANSLLLSAHFVTSAFLTELVRTATEDAHFLIPSPSKFRPEYSDTLSPEEKTTKTWEPNEERMHMFKEYRFIFVGEKGREINTDMKTTILSGWGQVETFNVHDGKLKFRKALQWRESRGDMKMAVVADTNTMALVLGKDKWEDLANEVKKRELEIITAADIVKAVIHVDLSLLSKSSGAVMDIDGREAAAPPSSFPAEGIPNTFPDEPSELPSTQASEGPAIRTRRASSRQPSQAPDELEQSKKRTRDTLREASLAPPDPDTAKKPTQAPSRKPSLAPPDPDPEEPAPKRTKLVRRFKDDGSAILTDPTDNIFGLSFNTTPAAPRDPAAPRRPLTRRTETKEFVSLEEQLLAAGKTVSKKPNSIKQFQALFDATDPAKLAGGSATLEEMIDTSAATWTQTQTGESQMGVERNQPLPAVQEEEEETQTQNRRLKRKAPTSEEDVEMQTVEGTLAMTPSDSNGSRSVERVPPVKKRAVEDVNAVEPSKDPALKAPAPKAPAPQASAAPTSKKPGAAPGKPDTDAAFLRALASTKRGKRQEDDFDRDFNKLRISKPDLEKDKVEKDWAVLDYNPDEWTSKGNFMVVVEMDIVRRARKENEQRAEWEGLPNYKKFKKTKTKSNAIRIELTKSEQNDYGVGSAYWKSSQSQSQTAKSQKPAATKKRVDSPLDSEDENETPPPPRRTKAKAPRTGSVTSTRAKSAKSQPLFLADDDDVQNMSDPIEDDDAQTLDSSAPSTKPPPKKAPVSKKRKAIVVDDDSDDGVFKGFKASERRPTKIRR